MDAATDAVPLRLAIIRLITVTISAIDKCFQLLARKSTAHSLQEQAPKRVLKRDERFMWLQPDNFLRR